MWKNRPRISVSYDMTNPVEAARARLIQLEDELEDLIANGAPDWEIEEYAIAIEDAEYTYWDLVDLETDAAIAEVEDAMEEGLDLW